jgi:hypothetical protein
MIVSNRCRRVSRLRRTRDPVKSVVTNETANALLVNADGAAKQQASHPIVARAHAEPAAMR